MGLLPPDDPRILKALQVDVEEQDNQSQSLGLPSLAQIEEWLRAHVKKPRPGRIARWLGEPAEFRYSVGPAQPEPMKFITRQTLFSVYGETGLLPFPTLPRGSRGVFAIHGEDWYLIRPDAESLSGLLSREGKPLDEAAPGDLAELFCLALPFGPRDPHRAVSHAFIESAAKLREYETDSPHPKGLGWVVDEAALRSVEIAIVPPTVTGSATTGWRLEFTTLAGWMHEKNQLGIEGFDISPAFEISQSERTILHERIFSKLPGVRY